MPDRVPTVMVAHPTMPGGYLIINESDFDPARHRLYEVMPVAIEPQPQMPRPAPAAAAAVHAPKRRGRAQGRPRPAAPGEA